jgi:plastocyanin
MMRKLVLVAALSAAIGCGGGSSYGGGGGGGGGGAACTSATATATQAVSMSAGMQFIPNCIKISKGSTVTWTNNDVIAHTATSDTAAEPFNSGTSGPGGTFQHAFANVAETVNYHCLIHGPVMSGTVIVE